MVYEINGNFVEIKQRIRSHVRQKFWICGNHRLIGQDKKDTLIWCLYKSYIRGLNTHLSLDCTASLINFILSNEMLSSPLPTPQEKW